MCPKPARIFSQKFVAKRRNENKMAVNSIQPGQQIIDDQVSIILKHPRSYGFTGDNLARLEALVEVVNIGSFFDPGHRDGEELLRLYQKAVGELIRSGKLIQEFVDAYNAERTKFREATASDFDPLKYIN